MVPLVETGAHQNKHKTGNTFMDCYANEQCYTATYSHTSEQAIHSQTIILTNNM